MIIGKKIRQSRQSDNDIKILRYAYEKYITYDCNNTKYHNNITKLLYMVLGYF